MNLSGSAERLKGKQLNDSVFKRSISRPIQSSRLWVFAAVQPQIALLVSSHFEALWVSRSFLPKQAAIISGGRVNKPGREYGRKHFPATAVALRSRPRWGRCLLAARPAEKKRVWKLFCHMWLSRRVVRRSHVDSISAQLSLWHRTRRNMLMFMCLPRRRERRGLPVWRGNGFFLFFFFWNPSLTELTERSSSDERRVKNASRRAAEAQPVIDNPWRRRWETRRLFHYWYRRLGQITPLTSSPY